MDDLLPEYERELAILRQSLGEFAQRYPNVAARLAISGGHSDDPHVERLIQSAALLNARASTRIEDDFPEFTHALLEMTYPEFLRPFPSCSIAQFCGSNAVASLQAPVTIERGVELKVPRKEYLFRTTYDVTLAPLQIVDARYALNASAAPRSITLPEETTGLLSITFSSSRPSAELGPATPETVRLFVDGERATVAAVIDALLLHVSTAFVEADAFGAWTQLERIPLSRVGFDTHEALIELPGARPSQYRLLREYFAFPQKFDFVDIDLRALLRCAGRCHRVTLHLPVSRLHPDSPRARAAQPLNASHLKLFCTPVVNLFQRSAAPIAPESMQFAVYPVVPDTLTAAHATVYSVDSVRLTDPRDTGDTVTPIMPYRSMLHHRTNPRSSIYWLANRDARLAEFLPGHDMLLSLVDESGQPIESQQQQVDAELHCTNGNLPASLPIGEADGDLVIQHNALAGRIVLLHRPTESVPPPIERWQLWELISTMAANPVTLDQAGLPALKALMAQHARPHAAEPNRHIASLQGLRRDSVMGWTETEPQPMFVIGRLIRLMVDDPALHDCTLSAFAGVLESVFANYVPATSFVQLQLVSGQNGAELARGKPVWGTKPIV